VIRDSTSCKRYIEYRTYDMSVCGGSIGLGSPTSPFARAATGLVRQYSTVDTFYIGISILGIGTFLIELGTWVPYAYPGGDVPLLMFFRLPVSVFVGLSWAYLAVTMPRSGGDYIFVNRTPGPRLGFLSSTTLAKRFGSSKGLRLVGVSDSMVWGFRGTNNKNNI